MICKRIFLKFNWFHFFQIMLKWSGKKYFEWVVPPDSPESTSGIFRNFLKFQPDFSTRNIMCLKFFFQPIQQSKSSKYHLVHSERGIPPPDSGTKNHQEFSNFFYKVKTINSKIYSVSLTFATQWNFHFPINCF
jgi:hypothetical protein